ncbi:MAG: hypothetical protein HOP08_02610 [Cyclobacteriaceae bacterium]|nr:hypothetical protein [Cyclobacteriaceae bacterium]
MKVTGLLLLTILSLSSAFAQLVEYPVASHQVRSVNSGARTQSAGPLILPFWDDFSYSDSKTQPDVNLWKEGTSVLLNNGIGINAPSKNCVTFDGTDSQGKTYSINDVLAKGYADSLVSLPIRMDLVDPALRPTVYFSFFYQAKGLGEVPDPGDLLILSFKNSDGKWEVVYSVENSINIDPSTFYQVIIPVADNKFYHNDFQFRFQNKARLSGAYDTWNVDYVYLNTNRNATDTFYPDRTISSSLTSLFENYFSVPSKHFLQNPTSFLKKPSVYLYNLQQGAPQTLSYSSIATITKKYNAVETTTLYKLDSAQEPGGGAVLNSLQFFNLTLNKIPPASAFTGPAESFKINFRLNVLVKDNIPMPAGDYDIKYSPIDFRTNDTTRTVYTLSNYYAYDDGQAEYAAGISQSGAYVAFKYLFKSNQFDTLSSVDIYFPQFGDNSSQSVLLQIRKDLSDAPGSILYQSTIQVNRTTQNLFTNYKLAPAVIINSDFYVGWKLTSNASILAGLDKNTDNGDKLYYNTNGSWIQNTTVKGSMMVRPVFGKGVPDPVSGLETVIYDPIYPNPTERVCYLPAGAEFVFAIDITGRKVETEIADLSDRKSLTFLTSHSGLVLIRYSLGGKLHTEKIMVKAQ